MDATRSVFGNLREKEQPRAAGCKRSRPGAEEAEGC